MRKWYVVVLILAVFAVCLSDTFTNKSWPGSDFPYIGALFLHSGDCVTFKCEDLGKGYGAFWYMLTNNRTAIVQVIVEGKPAEVEFFELRPQAGGRGVYKQGVHFHIADWATFRLGPRYIGHVITIIFREKELLEIAGSKIECPENDIIIRVPDGSATQWFGVDSTVWCDLDKVAKP